MPSLPLFGSESSPVAPATCCRVLSLVPHPCRLRLLSGATTRSIPGRHLSSSTACWSPLSPIFKCHRSFHAPTVLSSAAAAFFEPEGLLVTTVRCRAQLLIQRPPLAPDYLLVAPTTYSTSLSLFFSPRARYYPRCQYYRAPPPAQCPHRYLSSPTTRWSSLPLLVEPHSSFNATTAFFRVRSLVPRSHPFHDPVVCCRAPPLFLSSSACLSSLPVSSTGDMTSRSVTPVSISFLLVGCPRSGRTSLLVSDILLTHRS